MLETLTKIHNPVYTVIIRPCTDTSGYWAVCDMPNGGCTTQGETIQETQRNILESAEIYLEDYPEISNYLLKFEIQNA